METSAKYGSNVFNAFAYVAQAATEINNPKLVSQSGDRHLFTVFIWHFNENFSEILFNFVYVKLFIEYVGNAALSLKTIFLLWGGFGWDGMGWDGVVQKSRVKKYIYEILSLINTMII